MGRRRQFTKHYQSKRRNDFRNRGQARDSGRDEARGCSTDGSLSDRSVPSDLQFVTITANGVDGKWVSLFELDVLGIQFEAVLSSGSEGSVLSSRVYDLIEEKLNVNDDNRYKLQQVPSYRVRDVFGREIKQFGAVSLPCTIFGDCGTKKVEKDITFFVIDGGEIDAVVGAPAHSADVWELLFPVLGKPDRVPRVVGVKKQTEDSSAGRRSRSIAYMLSTIVGTKEIKNEALRSFTLSNSDGTCEEHRAVFSDELVYSGAILGASAFNSDIRDLIMSNLRQDQTNDRITKRPPVHTLQRAPKKENPAEGQTNETSTVRSPIIKLERTLVKESPDAEERCSPSDRIVTIVPMSSGEQPSMVKMKISSVPFEGALSIGSSGTVLSSEIYDQIVLKSKGTRRYRMEETSGVRVRDMAGNELKLMGTLRVPCTFISACGTNSALEQITFLVVDGIDVDCVVGKPEIFSCEISIILHRHLLVFNNHPSPIPITIVGAQEDSDIAFEKEKGENLATERSVSPVRVVTITLMTLTGKFPYMVKMDIVGLPLQLVHSSGTNGTILSSKAYDRILRKTSDPSYQLQKVTGIEVQAINRKPMKLLGILRAPCKFICVRSKKSVIEMMEFLVVENLICDGVLGSPELLSDRISMLFQRGNCTLIFNHYKPPIEIGVFETPSSEM